MAPAGRVTSAATFRLTGALARADGRPAAKLPVTVQRRVPGTSTWATLTSATTNATSGVSVPVRASRTYEYRLVHGGSQGLLWVRSPVRTVAVGR